jgi:microcystin degradation protein MlrC
MNYLAYKTLFEEILSAETPAAPYDKPDYLNYTKLNQSRMKRWDKHLYCQIRF